MSEHASPISLRNIPPEAMQMVLCVSQRLGVPVATVLRLALISGSLLELIKAGPSPAGDYAGFSASYLAELLRCHLAAPLDFLRQHPSGGVLPRVPATSRPRVEEPESEPSRDEEATFDAALFDELDGLGFGGGVSDA